MPNGDKGTPRSGLAAADLGLSFIVCVLICGAAGYGLDSYFGSKPWGILTGIAAGFAAWLWQMWKAFKNFGH